MNDDWMDIIRKLTAQRESDGWNTKPKRYGDITWDPDVLRSIYDTAFTNVPMMEPEAGVGFTTPIQPETLQPPVQREPRTITYDRVEGNRGRGNNPVWVGLERERHVDDEEGWDSDDEAPEDDWEEDEEEDEDDESHQRAWETRNIKSKSPWSSDMSIDTDDDISDDYLKRLGVRK